MNFLSSALTSLTGYSIPYTIKEEIVSDQSPWKVYNGTNPKQNNASVTVFEYNLKTSNDGMVAEAIKNCFRKLKLVKFPCCITTLDFFEFDDAMLYIVTEPVIPLLNYLKDHSGKLNLDCKIFGIYSVAQAIQFLNTKCNLVHGNISLDSIYVNPNTGDWKLFGFELLTNLNSDPVQPLYRLSSAIPSFRNLASPEVLNQGIESLKTVIPFKLDSYMFGELIYGIIQENYSLPYSNLSAIKLPARLSSGYKRLVNPNINQRITVDKFLMETMDFFSHNLLIVFNNHLEEIKFMKDEEKLAFFKYELASIVGGDEPNSNNNDSLTVFPPGLLEGKLLEELISQFRNLGKPQEYNPQNQETLAIILNYILRFGCGLPNDQFSKIIKPVLFGAYLMADRSIRLHLLNYLPNYVDKLTDVEVQLKIFYSMITGFQDSNFIIRENTLKSLDIIIDKISDKQVNQDLLKVLAKSQFDPKPSIRTNTIILIIRISKRIYSNSKNNVLITALSKTLKDTFTPCKMAALKGFESLIDEFSLEEVCGKILGHLAISLMDSRSAKVRDEADRIFKLYLSSVEAHASDLPRTEPDDDAEERAFLKKFQPQAIKPEETEANNDNTESSVGGSTGGALASFGWNMMSKLTPKGQLNSEFNTSTPDLTRAPSPNAQPIKPPTIIPDKVSTTKPPIVADFDDDFGDEDGWDMDDEPKVVPTTTVKKTTERVSKLKVSNGNPPRRSRPTATTTRSSGLKLEKKKPGASLNLDLSIDEDDGGWGGEW